MNEISSNIICNKYDFLCERKFTRLGGRKFELIRASRVNGKGIKMNLNPNKYSSAIVKTELYKCCLFPNLHAFSDHGENNLVNFSEYYI